MRSINHYLPGVFLFLIVIGLIAPHVVAQEIPSSIVKYVSNERINVYSVGPDGVADVVGFAVGEGIVTDEKIGGIANPTVNIFITKRISLHLQDSDSPLELFRKGLETGEIKISGVGAKSGIKISGFLEAIKRLAPENGQESPSEVSPENTLEDTISNVVERTEEGNFIIEKDKGLASTTVEISLPKLTEEDTIAVKEWSNLAYNEIPQGTGGLPFTGAEESIGRFIDITLPENMEWTVMKVEYTDAEVYNRNILEKDIIVKWFDENTGFWVPLKDGEPRWVNKISIDDENNIIKLNVSHNSVYGVGGFIATTQVPQKIRVRPPQPVQAEIKIVPQAQQVDFVEISTEGPNYAVWIGLGVVFLIIAFSTTVILIRRGRKAKKGKESEKSLEEESAKNIE